MSCVAAVAGVIDNVAGGGRAEQSHLSCSIMEEQRRIDTVFVQHHQPHDDDVRVRCCHRLIRQAKSGPFL